MCHKRRLVGRISSGRLRFGDDHCQGSSSGKSVAVNGDLAPAARCQVPESHRPRTVRSADHLAGGLRRLRSRAGGSVPACWSAQRSVARFNSCLPSDSRTVSAAGLPRDEAIFRSRGGAQAIGGKPGDQMQGLPVGRSRSPVKSVGKSSATAPVSNRVRL
jgi:hypothetical protein